MKRLAAIPYGLIVVAVALLTRAATLGLESLWFDEAFTFRVASPGTDFWRAILGDDHPPLWSMIQWLNLRLIGTSEAAYRLPAMLASVAACWLIYRIALHLSRDRKLALIAGLLSALLPASIYFGQDGRMYAFLAMLLLLMIYAAMLERWWLVALAGILAEYTQPAALMYIAAIGLVMLWHYGRDVLNLVYFARGYLKYRKPIYLRCARCLAKPFLALAAIALAYLPWTGIMITQAARVYESFWTPPLNPVNVLWPFILDTAGSRATDLLQPFIYGAFILLTAIGVWTFVRTKAYEWGALRNHLYIMVPIVGGPLLLALVSLLWGRSIYVYRPMLVSGLLLTIPWAYALTRINLADRRALQAATAIALAMGVFFYYTNNRREDMPTWLTPITSHWEPGDVIYYTNGTPAVTDEHYLPASYPYALRPYHGNVMSITDEVRSAFHMPSLQFDELRTVGYSRAWVVTVINPFTEDGETGYIASILLNHPVLWEEVVPTSKISVDSIYLVDLCSPSCQF